MRIVLIFLEASRVGLADGCHVGLWEKAAPERRGEHLCSCGLLVGGTLVCKRHLDQSVELRRKAWAGLGS